MCGVMQCDGLHMACNSDDPQAKDACGKNRKHVGGCFCLRRRSGCDGLCHVIVSSFPSHPTGWFHCAWLVSWLTDRSCFAAFPVTQWRVRKALSALQSRGRLWFLASRFGSAVPTFPFHPPKAELRRRGTVPICCACLGQASSSQKPTRYHVTPSHFTRFGGLRSGYLQTKERFSAQNRNILWISRGFYPYAGRFR